jgi:hypothetical protein
VEHGFDLVRMSGRQVRNLEWLHMINDHVISMPNKWEYPWIGNNFEHMICIRC